MYKCIVYDEDNNRKKLKLNLSNEEEVFSYANKNKFKMSDQLYQIFKNTYDVYLK